MTTLYMVSKVPFGLFLKYFDINGFVIDYIHGVCSGIMKLLLSLWLVLTGLQYEIVLIFQIQESSEYCSSCD